MNGTMIEGAARWGYDPIWYLENQVYTQTLKDGSVLVVLPT